MTRLPDELLLQVTPLALQEYARSRGWHKAQEVRSLILYRTPDNAAEAAIPTHPDFSDYGLRVAEAIGVFAQHEKSTPSEVLNDLLVPPADILRLGVQSPATNNGTLQLLDSIALLNGARKALSAAVYDELQPAAYHIRLSGAEAEAFVQHCRLGQTERGSFVATLICPIYQKATNQTELFPDIFQGQNFTRRVTTRFMKSVARLIQAIEDGDAESIVNPRENDLIISANFIEAILDVPFADENAALNLSCKWARTIPVQSGVPSALQITNQYVPMLETTAAKLRPRLEPKRDLYIGKVDSLRGKPDQDGHMQGEITFAFQAEEELLKAKVDLGPPDYAIACDAHKEDRYAAINGLLQRGNRIHVLTDHSGIRIVSPDNPNAPPRLTGQQGGTRKISLSDEDDE